MDVESVEPEKNPKYIKPSAFPRSVGISKKSLPSVKFNVQWGAKMLIAIDDPGPERSNGIYKTFFSF